MGKLGGDLRKKTDNTGARGERPAHSDTANRPGGEKERETSGEEN